jgi:hypothetical protein
MRIHDLGWLAGVVKQMDCKSVLPIDVANAQVVE